MESYFVILRFLSVLLKLYGVGSINIVKDVAFQDTEISVAYLVSLLTRVILRKCDSTEVNL